MSDHHDHDDHIHPAPTTFMTKYVFTIDHKVIGVQFLIASMFFVVIGGLLALGVRYQLAWPNQNVPYTAVLPDGEEGSGISMTGEAPEQNAALWTLGGPMSFMADTEFIKDGDGYISLDAFKEKVAAEKPDLEGEQLDTAVAEAVEKAETRFFPAGIDAEFAGFNNDFTVILPPETKVMLPGGSPKSLTVNTSARVKPQSIIADYNYSPQSTQLPGGGVASLPLVTVPAGTKVHLQNVEGDWVEHEVVEGTVYRPSPSGVATPDAIKKLHVPLNINELTIKMVIPAQSMPVAANSLDQLETWGVPKERIDTIRDKAAKLIESNKPIREEIEKVRRQISGEIEETTAKYDKSIADAPEGADTATIQDDKAAAVAALEEKRDDAVYRLQQSMTEEVVDVPIAAAAINSATAPQAAYFKEALSGNAYLTLFTMHATIMVFFVLMPTLLGTFGNFLIPLMIGARDMAFPKLNMLSFWISVPAGIIMIASFWVPGGASGGGWTMYPTHSSMAQYGQGMGSTLWLISIGLVGFTTIVGTLNYITTIINMRAPGMGMFRMPLTVWGLLITSILALFATPVLTAAAFMLLFDRILGTMFFSPMMEVVIAETGVRTMEAVGGQPLLWQHLFWFFGHPEVYILILPTMGIASDILATHARKPIFGYKPMVFAMAAISGLGFIVWGHHMFQSGMNPTLGTTFMAATIMIAVPSAIKTFNWLGTIWGGNIRFTTPMLFAIGFVSMFVIGGLSGIYMATAPVDIQLHDTYFIVAHIHYVFFGGTLLGVFAGVYQWYPKMFGTNMDQRWGKIHFWMTIIGLNGTFFLMHILGIGGHPRRYASIMEFPTMHHLQDLNVVMTIFAMMLGMAQIPFVWNFFNSLPGKASRNLTLCFVLFIGLPMVIGLSYWGAFTEGGIGYMVFGKHAVELNDGTATGFATYSGGQEALGYLLFLGLMGSVALLMLKQLDLGGKIGTVVGMGSVIMFGVYLMISRSSGAISNEAIKEFSVLGVSHNLMVAFGLSVIFMAIATSAVFGIWKVGAAIKMDLFINKALWILFLPLFLMPVVVKKEPYMWLGVPEWHPETWMGVIVFMAIIALPVVIYLALSRPRDAFAAPAAANPWEANSLEWTTTSPPPYYNFKEIPVVYRGPFEYSSPVVDEDYLPQTEKLPEGVVEPAGH